MINNGMRAANNTASIRVTAGRRGCRVLAGRIVITVDSSSVQREQITVTAFARSQPDDSPSLEDWADYFAPSIEQLLPSSERSFVPKVVSIERETFYHDHENGGQDELSVLRRVRVTRRRVTMVGTVQHG
jgi:hypothetical protein